MPAKNQNLNSMTNISSNEEEDSDLIKEYKVLDEKIVRLNKKIKARKNKKNNLS